MKTEGFIVHLARATARRPQVDELLRLLPVQSSVIDAIDGNLLTTDEITRVCKREIHGPYYPFQIVKSEIGCFMSHRAAWRQIVDRNLDAGVIIEDDVGIDPDNFSSALRFAQTHMQSGDYVRFPWRSHTDAGRVMAASNGLSLVEPRHVGVGMLAQVVGRDAALRLLDATESFDRPVDTFLQMRWAHHTRILALSGVSLQHLDAELGGSTLHRGRRPFKENVVREVLRARYRASVALHNIGRRFQS